MNVIKTDIEGVLIIEPRLFRDARGYFFESFSERAFKEKVIEMKDEIKKYELLFRKKENELQYLQQQIEDLRSKNRRLVDENQKLNKTLYRFQHPDLDEPEL